MVLIEFMTPVANEGYPTQPQLALCNEVSTSLPNYQPNGSARYLHHHYILLTSSGYRWPKNVNGLIHQNSFYLLNLFIDRGYMVNKTSVKLDVYAIIPAPCNTNFASPIIITTIMTIIPSSLGEALLVKK